MLDGSVDAVRGTPPFTFFLQKDRRYRGATNAASELGANDGCVDLGYKEAAILSLLFW